jgi:hypothetical protein
MKDGWRDNARPGLNIPIIQLLSDKRNDIPNNKQQHKECRRWNSLQIGQRSSRTEGENHTIMFIFDYAVKKDDVLIASMICGNG